LQQRIAILAPVLWTAKKAHGVHGTAALTLVASTVVNIA